MTPTAAAATTLDEFQRSAGVAVRASPIGPDLLLVLTGHASVSALAIVYDLSDSCVTTARLAARLHALLRGWNRTTQVWAYALGSELPIATSPPGTVGQILDGSIDLLAPTTDVALLADRRYGGSFIGPTLSALYRRTAEKGIRPLRVIYVGDGRLTDFRAAQTEDADLIGIIEHDTDWPAAQPRWAAVVGDAPLLPIADARVPGWFASRGAPASASLSLRVSGDGVRRLDATETPQPLGRADVDWHPREPLRLLVPQAATGFRIEVRSARGPTTLTMAAVQSAAAVDAEVLRAVLAGAHRTSASDANILFDSQASPADAGAAWAFAVDAAGRATQHEPWPALPAWMAPPSTTARPLVAVCFASRPPTLPCEPDDRVVVFAITSKAAGLTLAEGVGLPIGTPSETWRLRYDALEDRWRFSAASSATAGGVDSELHPTGSQRLPDFPTAENHWAAIFSGPL